MKTPWVTCAIQIQSPYLAWWIAQYTQSTAGIDGCNITKPTNLLTNPLPFYKAHDWMTMFRSTQVFLVNSLTSMTANGCPDNICHLKLTIFLSSWLWMPFRVTVSWGWTTLSWPALAIGGLSSSSPDVSLNYMITVVLWEIWHRYKYLQRHVECQIIFCDTSSTTQHSSKANCQISPFTALHPPFWDRQENGPTKANQSVHEHSTHMVKKDYIVYIRNR